jgi:putative component of membrane protein insertase Oxa1/YidC/SpoIIIJ protein YidD
MRRFAPSCLRRPAPADPRCAEVHGGAMRPVLQSASLVLIGLYQRHVSPHKGYVCALHARTGGRSCSRYAARAIARAGLLSATILLQRRLRACAAAAAALAQEEATGARPDESTPTFEDRAFGGCAPAVREGRKLCCGSLVGGMLSDSGR